MTFSFRHFVPVFFCMNLIMATASWAGRLKILNQTADQIELVEELCAQLNGKMQSEITCSETGKVRKGTFCVFTNEKNEEMFFNGCSGLSGYWGEVFFMDCFYHDHCYHHEPATHQKSQKQCDQELLSNMTGTCLKMPKKKSSQCLAMTDIVYRTLRLGGFANFGCSNTVADYPEKSEESEESEEPEELCSKY